MSSQFYFTITYLAFLALQGMAIATGGKIGKFFGITSYVFAIASICSYTIFLDKII